MKIKQLMIGQILPLLELLWEPNISDDSPHCSFPSLLSGGWDTPWELSCSYCDRKQTHSSRPGQCCILHHRKPAESVNKSHFVSGCLVSGLCCNVKFPTCFTSSQLLNPHTVFSHLLFLFGLNLLPCSNLHLFLLTLFPWVLWQKMDLFCFPFDPHCLLGAH